MFSGSLKKIKIKIYKNQENISVQITFIFIIFKIITWGREG